MNKLDEKKEKISYKNYMKAEGYIKINDKYILVKYPTKKVKSYKGK